MALAFQGSLLDGLDSDGTGERGQEAAGQELAGLGPLGALARRVELAHGAWVDLRPGWVSGADALFSRLAQAVPWQTGQRRMYDRVVDVPRLQCFYREGVPLPDPVLARAREALSARYAPELGEPLATAGLNLYRDGRDSVAWHGDTIGRGATQDTIVAIVSVGEPRALLLRPRGGGPSLRYQLGHGDLLVMGGSCQRTWEHAVPKTTAAAGPRISIQFRPRGVR
jgi:alkylated DNA repair dioxygenase AlkB